MPSRVKARSTQIFRGRGGYTIIELMTVIAIVGIMSAIGIAALKGYTKHEDTRKAALSVAGLLTKARTTAMATGHMTFVVFGEPTDGSAPFVAGQYAALVTDNNDSKAIDDLPDPADTITPIFLPAGINQDVTIYGAHGDTGMKNTPLPSIDEHAAGGKLINLVDGTTFPVDGTVGVPVVAFSAQGSAVTLAPPHDWGTGAGGIYLTDSDQMVFGIVVQPLGDVRTLAFDDHDGTWK
jgi:prepilin-type N-terminal cleavage/methylation domain-containing protein